MNLVTHKLERGHDTKLMPHLRDREAPSTKHKTRSRAHGGRASHVSFRGQKNSRFFRRNDDCV